MTFHTAVQVSACFSDFDGDDYVFRCGFRMSRSLAESPATKMTARDLRGEHLEYHRQGEYLGARA